MIVLGCIRRRGLLYDIVLWAGHLQCVSEKHCMLDRKRSMSDALLGEWMGVLYTPDTERY